MKNERQGQIIIKHVPEELKKLFKSQCAIEGKTMQVKLLELIISAVPGYRT